MKALILKLAVLSLFILPAYTMGQSVSLPLSQIIQHIFPIGLNNCEADVYVAEGLPPCPAGTLQLVFEDHFNGDSLNTQFWQTAYPWGRAIPRDYELQIYRPRNVEVSNGTLKLLAREEDYEAKIIPWEEAEVILEDGKPNLRLNNYSSGMIFSKTQFTYGRYEIRFRGTQGHGRWPAFWMYGGDFHHELDFFDNWEAPDVIRLGSIHDYFENNSPEGCGERLRNSRSFSHWHVLQVDYVKDMIIWRLDQTEIFRMYRWANISGQVVPCGTMGFGTYQQLAAFPDEPMHLIANLAIRGKEFHPRRWPEISFPSMLEIDYIKVYQYKEGCCEDIIVANAALLLEDNAYNWFCARNVSFELSTQSIPANSVLTVSAAESISLLPQFTIEAGATVTLKLGDNHCDLNPAVHSITAVDEAVETEIFPNPVSDYLFIEDVENYRIEIFNMQGVKMGNVLSLNNEGKLDIRGLPQGTYVLSLRSKDQTGVRQLLVQKN